jgi:sortase A
LTLFAAGAFLLTEQGWLAAKACLAEVLIDRALAAHLRDGAAHRPWSWADMHPIARLEVPRLGVRRAVLSGATGSSLAFGPGHVDGTAPPNARGNCAVAGHRDSWFAFLEELRVGDRLYLRTHGHTERYVVQDLIVATKWDSQFLAPAEKLRLTLITCYPFGGLRRSDLRYVVVCRPQERTTAEVSRLVRRVRGTLVSNRWRFASSATPAIAVNRSRGRSTWAHDASWSPKSSTAGSRPTIATSRSGATTVRCTSCATTPGGTRGS